MEEVRTTGTYREFKAILDKDFRTAAETFVHIGYMLKLARDTEVLKESGYNTVAAFAKAEYGLSPDLTSRYMAINDRYSVDGYSECLEVRFQGYGMSKLAEMLTLPDTIIESMDPAMTREDIRSVKKEIEEERKISDIEVLIEGQQEETRELDMLQKIMYQYFYTHRQQFTELGHVLNHQGLMQDDAMDVLDVIAPSGMGVITERVQGIGKFMVFLRGLDMDIDVQNVRTMEKDTIGWPEFIQKIQDIYIDIDFVDVKSAWEAAYREPYEEKKEESVRQEAPKPEPWKPKKPEIAPAQKTASPLVIPKGNPDLKEPEKQPEKELESIMPKPVEEDHAGEITEKPEEQIPGQDNIENHPEYLPEGYEAAAKIDGEPVKAAVEPTEEQRKEECHALISMLQGNVEIQNYAAALKNARHLIEHLEVLSC